MKPMSYERDRFDEQWLAHVQNEKNKTILHIGGYIDLIVKRECRDRNREFRWPPHRSDLLFLPKSSREPLLRPSDILLVIPKGRQRASDSSRVSSVHRRRSSPNL
ncbi:hypothetical protein EVAR_12274_1 [Eumeta japonica]|uniref:Uncharacterized protein n=1 Tax=Eumeta variegata TaxID=151549 RepID=A0A4C1TUJ3_EUMVA|nr:hypothetical protein EVAR_12274_1 [Eumeta japonica]